MRLAALSLILASQLAISSNLQDVIYKKDGSILRGNLIEQDFTNGTYKIQLMGGSVFNITKDDIEKITKEAPFTPLQASSGININVENSPSINQTPVIEQQPTLSQQANAYVGVASVASKKIEDVFYIGWLGHTVTLPFKDSSNSYQNLEVEAKFKGVKLAYQKNYSDHIAIHYAVESAKLHTVEVIDKNKRMSDDTVGYLDFESTRYLGLYASLLASTNHQQGWQFFSGAGLFSHQYESENQADIYNANYSGLRLELGLGYSWQTLQAMLHAGANLSDDYPDEVTSVTGVSFEMGFVF